MPTTVTITRTTHIQTDNDGDNVADAGDVIRTLLHIVNVGAQDALNLSVSDNFTGSTLVPGSIKITPIAFDDSYSGVTGNTPITFSAAAGVLSNDVDPDGAGGNAGLTVTKIGAVAIGGAIAITGGTVDMHADGSFVFTPTTGFNGTATFNYTIADAQGLNNVTTGTVNIQVNGGMIWYVDNSASAAGQDGSYLHPFQQLSSLNGTANNGSASGDPDGTGDTIFVYHNSATHYTGGITLEAGQKLYGDGHSLLVNGHNIGGTESTGGVDNVATNAIIDHSGVGVTLSTDNEVQGLDLVGITNNTAIGIADGNGSVTTAGHTLLVSNVGISGTGQIVDIDQGGTIDITLTSAASTAATNGAGNGAIDLNGVQGNFTVTGATTINGSQTGGGIDITASSGTLAVALQGNLTVNTGATDALNFSNNILGSSTLAISGGTKDITTTTGNAVVMTGNTGTTESFTGGGLNIDTTTGNGLNVGGGTINITGANNTIDTTSGQILIASNASVGASGVTLATLTNTLATTTGNAIDINNLDGNSFTVSGNVTIANTGTGFDALNIRGGSSTNFAFNGNTDINGVGANGDGVELNGANGTVTFANLTVDGMVAGTGNGVLISGATNAVTVSGAIGTGLNTGDAVNITGGTGAVTVNASIAKNDAGNIVEVNGHATGAISFTGALNASATASGINLVDNTSGAIGFTNSAVNLNTGANTALNFTNAAGGAGAAVTFSGGNLNIDTTSGTGINATSTTANVGSLTINGAAANNSVTAASGRAINVDGVTSDLTFHDVSKSGGSTTAIFLRNTDGAAHNTGQFVITGTGTTGGTGGTIANIDDAGTDASGATANQTGSGIEMTNVSNVSLSNMVFGAVATTIANLGIHGEGVNNFTLKNTNFLGNFGDNQSTGPDEDVIRFGTQNAANNGLTGTGSFLGDNIQGGGKDNLAIFNGGSGSLNFSFTDLDAGHQAVMGHNRTGGNTGIQIQTGGTAGGQGGGFNLTASITNTQFDGNRGDAIFIEALQHTTQNITVSGNAFNDTQSDKLGGFVNVNGSAAGGTNYAVNFNIHDNTMVGALTSPIVAVYSGQDGKIAGIIANNTIGTPGGGTDSSGSVQGNGIQVLMQRVGGAGDLEYAVHIDNNNIHDLAIASGGIALRANNSAGGGTARLEATITNNTIDELGTTGGGALSALFLQLGGNGVGDTGILGVDLKNNHFTVTSTQLAVVDIDQVSSTATLNVPGYGGTTSGQAAANALNTFWTTTNSNTFTQANAPSNSAFSTYGAALNGVTHNAFTNPVPLLAVVPAVLPWEDDPANQHSIVVTSDQGEQPPVTVTDATDPGSGGHVTPTAPTGGPAVVDASVLGHPTVVDDGVVSQAELNLIVSAAIQRWADAGLAPDQLAAMRAVEVTVSDMMGLYVGASNAGQIHIDSDAAGYGWFVDTTPDADSEFDGSGTRLTAEPGGPADHRIDLLTVVMHELGHQIGLDDTYAAANFQELMYGYVNPGERRLPGSDDAQGAVPGSLTHEEYAVGPITSVTSLPAGKAVDITFDSTVNSFSNQIIPVFHNQATVSGTNLTASPVTSNVEDLVVDTLTLGDKVFIDVNANGVFDAGDTGVANVALTLYADSNGNGVLDGAELTNVIAIATTNVSGVYSFSGLAPGDYVVSLDASNFTAGGALVGKSLPGGAIDPDVGNVDNDNNGIAGPGGTVISAPIRLDQNSETTADGTGKLDINNTLDFGFLSANQAPAFTGLDGTPSFTEGGAAVVLDGDATVSDPNLTATNYAGAILTLARTGAASAQDVFGTSGTLSFSAPGSGNVLVGATTVGTFTQSGGTLAITFNTNATQALVNTTLQDLTYSNNSDSPPASAVIAYVFNDGNSGAQGSGGALTASGSVTVSIASVNDAPSGTDSAATILEDGTYTFSATDFSTGFSDVDGNAFSGILVTASPTSGILLLDPDGAGPGPAVLAMPGQFVTAAQLAAGDLTYHPASNGNGTPYATFTFEVRDNGGTANGGQDTDQTPNTFTFNVTSVDDPAVANNDSGSTNENASVNIAVLANDSDPDGPPLGVSQVNGQAISVGSPVFLPSGAAVFLNNDGTLTYDPNGQFNTLTSTSSGETGAVNTSAPDSFTYTLSGSPNPTATVSITVNGVASVQDHLEGDAGNNVITGTPVGDYFDLSQGGNDTVSGLGANDGFFFGAAFTGADTVDGGGGTNDQIGLQGDYTGGNALVMGANTITNVEAIVVLPGFSYDITMNDGNVAAGGLLKVQATQLGAGESLHFDGSAEHDGTFIVYGGQGNDTMIGGDGNDGFYFGPGGFTSGDSVDGGPGNNDQLGLDGSYGAFGPAFELSGGNIANVEVVVLLPGPSGSPNNFNLTTNDTLVSAGQTMTIFGLQVATDILFDGSHEHDGAFKFYGGSGNDVFTGSSGNDWIFGGGGADLLTGGLGSDTFYYDDASQSTSLGYDKLIGFDDSNDKIDLPFAVTGFAAPASGDLSTATFDAQLGAAFAGLTSHQAGTFTATTGDLAGHTFLVVDADGNAGYQAGSDYVIEVVTPPTPVDNPAIFV